MKSNYKNTFLCTAMLLLLLPITLYSIFNPEKAIAQLNRPSNDPQSTAPVIEKLEAQPISSTEFWNKLLKLIAADNGYITPGELEKTFGFRFTHSEHIGELATQYTVVPNSNWRVPITLTMFSAASIGVGGVHSGLVVNLRPNPWFYGCENYRDLYPIIISWSYKIVPLISDPFLVGKFVRQKNSIFAAYYAPEGCVYNLTVNGFPTGNVK